MDLKWFDENTYASEINQYTFIRAQVLKWILTRSERLLFGDGTARPYCLGLFRGPLCVMHPCHQALVALPSDNA